MHVRAIAFALPLVLGIACKTTHSRSDASTQTARTESGQAAGQATTSEPKTAGEPTQSQDSGTSASTRSSAGAASGSSASTSDSSTGPYVPSPSADTATGSGATAAQDPLMQPGDRIKAHSDDNVVSGKIARVSRRMVVIETDAGEQKPVFIVPETQIQVDGQDAQRSDLKQGQDVRASFNNVDGRDVAVVIHAGAEANASPDDPNAAPGASSPSSPGMDSSGSSPSGSRQ